MPKYMLLLYNDPSGWARMSPDEQQKGMAKYRAWSDKLRQKKVFIAAHKLAEDPGKVVRGNKGKPRISDGPYSETKEVLGGYYLIEAANYEQAIEQLRDCPHLEHGTVEVREVDARTG